MLHKGCGVCAQALRRWRLASSASSTRMQVCRNCSLSDLTKRASVSDLTKSFNWYAQHVIAVPGCACFVAAGVLKLMAIVDDLARTLNQVRTCLPMAKVASLPGLLMLHNCGAAHPLGSAHAGTTAGLHIL